MTESPTTTGPFDAHGFTFEISSPAAELIDAVDDVLVDMRLADDHRTSTVHRIDIDPAVGTSGTHTACRVRLDGESVHESLMEGSVLSHVLMEVNRRATASVWANGSIALHASVVAGPGGAVVVAGASHSGKTTLATALALAGEGRFAFVADEVCALDPVDLTVTPYGKPAALRTPGSDLLAPRIDRLRRPGSRFERDERFVPPRDLGRAPSGPCPVRAVVFPRFLWSADTIEGTSPPQPTGPPARPEQPRRCAGPAHAPHARHPAARRADVPRSRAPRPQRRGPRPRVPRCACGCGPTRTPVPRHRPCRRRMTKKVRRRRTVPTDDDADVSRNPSRFSLVCRCQDVVHCLSTADTAGYR